MRGGLRSPTVPLNDCVHGSVRLNAAQCKHADGLPKPLVCGQQLAIEAANRVKEAPLNWAQVGVEHVALQREDIDTSATLRVGAL